MAIIISESKLKSIIHNKINSIIKEMSEYQPSKMEEINYECKHLIEYLDFYKQVLTNIPKVCQNIINGLTEELGKLCNVEMVDFNYSDDDEMSLVFRGDFNSILQNPNFNQEEMELLDFIGENIGSYNKSYNYGSEGLFEAYVRGVYYGGNYNNPNQNEIEVNVQISPYANPMYLRRKLKGE